MSAKFRAKYFHAKKKDDPEYKEMKRKNTQRWRFKKTGKMSKDSKGLGVSSWG